MSLQIDVKEIKNEVAECLLYTGDRCVKIYMTEHEYRNLIQDGFFIRTGKDLDSAGILNTTETYETIKH